MVSCSCLALHGPKKAKGKTERNEPLTGHSVGPGGQALLKWNYTTCYTPTRRSRNMWLCHGADTGLAREAACQYLAAHVIFFGAKPVGLSEGFSHDVS